MKQLLQRLDSGEIYLEDVPSPTAAPHTVVVQSRCSVVSAGTESMLVDFGRAGYLEKARRQPERVKQVIEKAKADGLRPTWEAVTEKLTDPISLGYCNSGVIREVGEEVGGFSAGDRVVTNGAHAEIVRVPHTLCARIPAGVDFARAAWAPLGAVALQGIRNAEIELGETVVVYGLGLVGLLSVQLLRAHGCRVLGIDRIERRLELAESFGALPIPAAGPEVVDSVRNRSPDGGADAVLLTLATDSSDPVQYAARMSRRNGRLVLVGVAGLDLEREDYYKKELSLTVSCSYGPGRYDPTYEEQGQDYPLAHVRWTAQRNFQAFLDLLEQGDIDPGQLVSDELPFEEAPQAYDLLRGGKSTLGIVFTYDTEEETASDPVAQDGTAPQLQRTVSVSEAAPPAADRLVVGVIGAGSFAMHKILPALRDRDVRLRAIASSGGRSGTVAARRFGFELSTTSTEEILEDPDINVVFVLTPHVTHAPLAARALKSGKHVFVEKPLAIDWSGLEHVAGAAAASDGMLTVGFNRRFARLTRAARDHLEGRAGPLSVIVTVNAGEVPEDHWIHDPDVGGGRIIGEGCHFIDLARYLAGEKIVDVDVESARDLWGRPIGDLAHILLVFEDGSTGAIHYLSSGHRSFGKERIDCFFDGKILQIDNWRKLRTYGTGQSLWRRLPRSQDKGHDSEIEMWLQAIREGGPPPIPYEELIEVSQATLRAAEQLPRPRGDQQPTEKP